MYSLLCGYKSRMRYSAGSAAQGQRENCGSMMAERQRPLLPGCACRARTAWSILAFLCLTTAVLVWLVNSVMTTTWDQRWTHSAAVHVQRNRTETLQRLVKVSNAMSHGGTADEDVCPVFRLNPREELSEHVLCKRADFEPGSCRIMKQLFSEKPGNCSHQKSDVVCEIKEYSPEKPQIHCHHDVCKNSSSISIGLYQEGTGQHQWHEVNTSKQLEAFITSELLVDFHILHPGYCFIRCQTPTGRQVSQLLILPPSLHHSMDLSRRSGRRSPLLNVNILLLDSVSRHHFYRTMPQTINAFRKMNEVKFPGQRVFDYKLVQGTRGRTFESLEALFGGTVADLLPDFGLPSKPLGLNETLGTFKAFGYETLYVEDMCWLWEWGLVQEQGALNPAAPLPIRAKLFNRAIKRAGIDRVDVSYSSCSILTANNVRDMFHGPSAICYNGFHQHVYLLQYMEYFMTRFSSLKKPTFTFLILDTGHEDTGNRIKQLDEDLARHVFFLASQQHTVSFIISDHGNTYGQFIEASAEAQVEVFHPMLFVIVPDRASIALGERKIKSLRLNQNRLISLIDVHYTLKGLLPSVDTHLRQNRTYNTTINGLLSPVSADRSCEDIPRIHPNLCICQGYYTSQTNDSYYALFAEFALGHMNKKIQHQKKGTQGSCQRLIGSRFGDVKISGGSRDSTEVIVKFDLHVRSSLDATQEEKFAVSVQFSFIKNMEVMIFLGYERLSPYRHYQSCTDPRVDVRLCLCEVLTVPKQSPDDEHQSIALPESILWTVTHRTPVHPPCLHLLTRNYTSGVALSVHNACAYVWYNLHFDFLTQNLLSSNKMPITNIIGSKMEQLLVVGIRKVQNLPWKYKYILNFTMVPL